MQYLEDLLAHPEKIYAVMKEDLEEIRAKYGENRKTELSITREKLI